MRLAIKILFTVEGVAAIVREADAATGAMRLVAATHGLERDTFVKTPGSRTVVIGVEEVLV